MPKLTDTQLIVLSKAAQREDRAAMLPKGMSRASAAKVASSLINRKLMREMRAKNGMPVWRMDDEGRSYSLIILRAGRVAINLDDGEMGPTQKAPAIKSQKQPDASNKNKNDGGGALSARSQTSADGGPRAGSKQARVIAMLLSNSGATIDEIAKATDWLAHTTRAVLTGLRKRGYTVERERHDSVTRYRITSSPEAKKAA